MPLNIGLVYDLRSDYVAAGFAPEVVAEFDSSETIDALESAIQTLGYGVERIGNARALCARLVAGARWDLVFNVAEGLYGRSRESQVPALLELYGVGYTFSDPLVCAATLDKAVAKRLVRSRRVRTPRFAVLTRPSQVADLKLQYPLFAKPVAEGSSKGIGRNNMTRGRRELSALVRNLLSEFRQPVLVEEYLCGREFTVGILGTGDGARVLGTLEVVVSAEAGGAVYSYETKEQCEKLIRYVPLERGRFRKKVEKLALASYRVLECRDAGRIDVRCDARGRPSFIEANPLPGLHPTHSDLPMIAAAENVAYTALIGSIMENACARLGIGL